MAEPTGLLDLSGQPALTEHEGRWCEPKRLRLHLLRRMLCFSIGSHRANRQWSTRANKNASLSEPEDCQRQIGVAKGAYLSDTLTSPCTT